MRMSAMLLSWMVLARVTHAAPCDQGFPMKQGTVVEATRFNAQHQSIGRVVTTIVSSVTEGDAVKAVQTIDNLIGASKTSTVTADLVCDGKTVSINTRNDNVMRDWYSQVSDPSGSKIVGAIAVTEPQVYPLAMKVGDTLPPYRQFSMMMIKRGPPDWASILANRDWTQLIVYAMTSKIATGSQMVTTNIKVAGQETCTLPGGAKAPCWRITKDMFAKPLSREADLKRDIKELAKGAIMQSITEWFAPGAGVVKWQIALNGMPLVTMDMTALKN